MLRFLLTGGHGGIDRGNTVLDTLATGQVDNLSATVSLNAASVTGAANRYTVAAISSCRLTDFATLADRLLDVAGLADKPLDRGAWHG